MSAVQPSRGPQKPQEGASVPQDKPRSRKDDSRVIALPTGRPSKYSERIADYIIAQMHMGRTLVDICDHDTIAPHYVTVYRWIEMQSAFANRIARARKAMAARIEADVVDLMKSTTQSTANADRVKLQGLQWLAARRDPATYADKALGVDVTINLDALVAGSYAIEKDKARPRKGKVIEVQPQDVVTSQPSVAELEDATKPSA